MDRRKTVDKRLIMDSFLTGNSLEIFHSYPQYSRMEKNQMDLYNSSIANFCWIMTAKSFCNSSLQWHVEERCSQSTAGPSQLHKTSHTSWLRKHTATHTKTNDRKCIHFIARISDPSKPFLEKGFTN